MARYLVLQKVVLKVLFQNFLKALQIEVLRITVILILVPSERSIFFNIYL